MSLGAVVDSTYLIGLERIERLDIVPRLFSQVSAPPAVVEEFGKTPDWLNVQEVVNRTLCEALRTQLGAGESEVIALSTEMTDVVVVLDDKKARRVAHEMRLKVMGTVGLLLRAKQRDLLPELKAVLDSLESVGFRLSEELLREALRLAKEGD